MIKVNKEQFEFVQSDQVIYDEKFQTKPIGYYKDAFIRFRKNKASVVAAIILIFIILMSIVGPHFKTYSLPKENAKWSMRLAQLPPRVPGLEWLGFDGSRELEGFPGRFEGLPEGIVIKKGTKTNAIGQIKVTVDYYKFRNYQLSYESYTSLNQREYDAVKEYEQRTGETLIIEERGLVEGSYRVKIHFFEFLQAIYGVENYNFWFGTDNFGKDLFTELWSGAQLSLLIAFGVSLINIFVGVIVGSISGYYGGTLDLIIERFSEILSGLPFMAILTLLLLRYGMEVWVVILAFTLTGWLGISSLTRSQFYRYKNREYVLAARTLGANDVRIMSRHIFPSAMGTLITSVVLYVPSVIFSESTYSYLGIINYSKVTSVGKILSAGQAVMKESFYMVLFPSIFISLLMLSFNLFGNGLRDAFNPSLRGVEE
ncbi:MAG TPA: ABC transporter permease [Acholeplasmataceae bacterium]|nr:ABC transporter permease [Acholeplasmataceae bacterium]